MKNLLIIFLLFYSSIVKSEGSLTASVTSIRLAIDDNHLTTIYFNIINQTKELEYLVNAEIVDYPEAKLSINKTVIDAGVARIIKIENLIIPSKSTISLKSLRIFLAVKNYPKATKNCKIKFNFTKGQSIYANIN